MDEFLKIATLSHWDVSLRVDHDSIDATAFGDVSKTFLVGLNTYLLEIERDGETHSWRGHRLEEVQAKALGVILT